MQLNLVLAHQFIKKHAFFEASLHPVNCKREGFLDEVSKVVAKHKIITVPVLSTLLVSQKKVDFLNQLVRKDKEKC